MLSPSFLGAAVGKSFSLSKVFANTLYTGNGSSQQLITGLDFVNKNGLTWHKRRDLAQSHILFDTIRDQTVLSSDRADSEAASSITYNTDGVTLGTTGNTNGGSYVVWQWLVEQGFLDIVEYTGTGSAQTILHNLGADVGLLIVKNRDTARNWTCWHNSFNADTGIFLNLDSASDGTGGAAFWNSVLPSQNSFDVGTFVTTNENTNKFIAYIFAHNPSKGIFCGSYTGTGAAGNKQTTGFPVGLVLIKRTDGVGLWYLIDKVRGGASTNINLRPNIHDSEFSAGTNINFLSDGFDFSGATFNNSTDEFIYMAIADPNLF